MDCHICFYRQLFTVAIKPGECISWSWSALIGLHGIPNYSPQHSWSSLRIVSVYVTYCMKAQHCSLSLNGALSHVQLPTLSHLPPPPLAHPLPIDSIRVITGAEKTISKPSSIQIHSL